MGLYNMLFGRNPMSSVILGTLGITTADVGRFRDCFVADGEIAVYTRNGGGNRSEYQDVFDALSKHPCYLRDADDDFDCTYATIFFRFPDQYGDFLRALDTGTFNPDQRWLDYFKQMEEPGYQPPSAVSDLVKQIAEALTK